LNWGLYYNVQTARGKQSTSSVSPQRFWEVLLETQGAATTLLARLLERRVTDDAWKRELQMSRLSLPVLDRQSSKLSPPDPAQLDGRKSALKEALYTSVSSPCPSEKKKNEKDAKKKNQRSWTHSSPNGAPSLSGFSNRQSRDPLRHLLHGGSSAPIHRIYPYAAAAAKKGRRGELSRFS